MHIAVCIKQIPDAPSIRIDGVRMSIIRDGVESIINPLDVVALEAALSLREKEGGKVVVLTMGPSHSEEALLEALAAGADLGVLITDPRLAGADTLATSHTLARAISLLEPFPDLILCGRQSMDSDTGQVGPQIAEELDLPQACGVMEINAEGSALIVRQVSDGFMNTFRVILPALLTVSRELCVPRCLSFSGIERAFSKGKILRWGLEDLKLKQDEVGFDGSATKVLRLYRPPPKKRGEVKTGSTGELVKSIIHRLESLTIIDEESGAE
ncbi:MAG: electron transfer flavoprotein subunit beta/FixA family protein [Deltaproteobacteria bacterium]|nr:electron transfer flavoprotein subunit beta/FixA family protein [Deltaproteobacteria bacterium]